MKKLEIKKEYWDKDIYGAILKINEIVSYLNFREQQPLKPKKLEVRHLCNYPYAVKCPQCEDEVKHSDFGDSFTITPGKGFMNFCYTDKENEVIKKCLKYCQHRLERHTQAGIIKALSNDDVKTYYKLMEKL